MTTSRPVSGAEGLDPARLRLWANAAKESVSDSSHPMFAWRRIAELGARPTSEAVAARWREIQAATRAGKAVAPRREKDIVLADFGRSGFRGLVRRGPGVRPGADSAGRGPPRDRGRTAGRHLRPRRSLAHSGQLSRRLQGTLRSPSFSIDRRFLHVLAAGRASRINVVVEHFVMIQNPLYGRLRPILNDDGPRWHTFDLEMWRGRRAYLEFADTTTQDLHDMGPPAGCGPEGYVAVGDVLLSDQGPAGVARARMTVIGLLGDEPVDSPRGARRALRARRLRIARGAGRGLIARPDRRRGPGRPARVARRPRIAGPRGAGGRPARLAAQILPGDRGPAPRAPARAGHDRGDARGRAGLPPRQPEDRSVRSCRAGCSSALASDRGVAGSEQSAAGVWISPGGSPTRPTR